MEKRELIWENPVRKEIKRISNWDNGSGGNVNCLKCGKLLTLYFNGGELDQLRCCGLVYYTIHTQIDLVIAEMEDG